MKHFYIIIWLLMIWCYDTTAQNISGYIESINYNGDTIFLREIIGNQSYDLDSVVVKNQHFQFSNRKFHKGYYLLGFEHNEIQIILTPEESHVDIYFRDVVLNNNLSVIKSHENKLLWDYKYVSRDVQQRINELGSQKLDPAISNIKIDSLKGYLAKYKSELAANYPDTYFAKSIATSYARRYSSKEEEKEHYFDNIDFSDSSLIRSNIFPSRILRYLKFYTNYDEIGFKESVDLILNLSRPNELIYQSNLIFLLNLFDEIGPDIIFEYLATEYVLNDELSLEIPINLRDKILTYQSVQIGNIIPDHMLDREIALLKVAERSNLTLLFFWSSECHYCHEQLPDLKNLYQNQQEHMEIIAYSLDTNEMKWKEAISSNELNWLNYSDLKGWDSEFATKFMVNRTPTYYLMDHTGTIIAKPGNSAEVVGILENLTK